jgi:hypothetical protein
MVASTDMSTPVTRGELRDELELFGQELRQEFKQELVHLATKAELAQLASQMATKADLESWGGALRAHIDRTEQRLSAALSAELARHAGALQESMSALFAASDEQYADLPARVSRLEATVFAPKQR